MRRITAANRLALLLAMLVVAAGCSKVTEQNYRKLDLGMEYQEVVRILGQPEHCQSVLTAKDCIWGRTPKTISVKFIADKVVLFSATGL